MNFTMKPVLGAVLLTALATSCAKQPSADYTTDKKATDVIEIKESIKFTNTSVDAESYKWDFGDGTTSTEASPSKAYDKAGSFKVVMTAYSKKEKKSAQVEGAVNITNPNVKFAGTYQGNWVIDGTSETGTLSINAGSDPYKIQFVDASTTFSGDVSDKNITVANQTVNIDGDSYTISGNGTLNGFSISLNLTLSASGVTFPFSFTGSK